MTLQSAANFYIRIHNECGSSVALVSLFLILKIIKPVNIFLKIINSLYIFNKIQKTKCQVVLYSDER